MNKNILILVILPALLVFHFDASAQASRLLRELGEVVFKTTGKESLEELVELGGKAGTKEILERAVREGGEELGEKVVAYTRKYGVDALHVVSEDPRMMVSALESVSGDVALKAITEGARNPQLLTGLVRQHGKEVLEVAAKYPNVGLRVVETYGETGLKIAQQLEVDDMIILARHTKAYNNLPVSAKQQFTDLLSNDPKTVLTYLAGVTGIGLTAKMVQNMEEILVGSPDEPGPLIKPIIIMAWILGAVLLLLLVGYFSPKIWGNFQRERFKTVREDKKASNREKRD